ncbi:MAG: sigma-70 family RNA polymerase sigma factor [Actinomycetota bacterium]
MARGTVEDGPVEEDAELVRRIAEGDRAAFERLYDRYAASAFGIARRVCGDASLAEDVVQEAFLSIWRRPTSYSPDRGKVGSYLFGVVHNKAVDAIRHEESLRRREQAYGGVEEEAGAADEVVEGAWIALRGRQVREAVAGLSAVQREAIELAYFGGLTCTEVATKLGIPLGTAKTRLRDGMIRLRNVLRVEE